MRCFVAVPISEAVRREAVRVQDALRASDADVRWEPEANLHLTLKFLGEMEEPDVERLKGLLAAEASGRPRMSLRYVGLGSFPGGRRAPRVVWAGVEGDVAPLKELAEALSAASELVGIAPEERPYSPHLTIGRVRSPRNVKALAGAIEARRTVELGADDVGEIVLMQSHLSPKGATYEPVATFPLRGA